VSPCVSNLEPARGQLLRAFFGALCGLLQHTHLYLSVRAGYTSRDLTLTRSGHDDVTCSSISGFIGGLGTGTHQNTGTEKELEEKEGRILDLAVATRRRLLI
jgi:hypothetical protein